MARRLKQSPPLAGAGAVVGPAFSGLRVEPTTRRRVGLPRPRRCRMPTGRFTVRLARDPGEHERSSEQQDGGRPPLASGQRAHPHVPVLDLPVRSLARGVPGG